MTGSKTSACHTPKQKNLMSITREVSGQIGSTLVCAEHCVRERITTRGYKRTRIVAAVQESAAKTFVRIVASFVSKPSVIRAS